jgi:hypothetical protein
MKILKNLSTIKYGEWLGNEGLEGLLEEEWGPDKLAVNIYTNYIKVHISSLEFGPCKCYVPFLYMKKLVLLL